MKPKHILPALLALILLAGGYYIFNTARCQWASDALGVPSISTAGGCYARLPNGLFLVVF